MGGAMWALVVLFAVVFILNVIPAFAPPTWLVFSFVGFQYPLLNGVEVALIGALAATLGRLMLAVLSRVIVRGKFLSESTKQNIDAIKLGLQGKRKLTFGLLLFYAFSPLPSNYVFIAYGLTALDLKLIAVPFFLGRSVSYSFWRITSSAMARKLDIDSAGTWPYLSAYFIATQIAFLCLVYLFTKIDWKVLLIEKKL